MFKSFKYASQGIVDAFKNEHNLRIHFLAGFLAFNLAYIFGFNYLEWTILVLIVAAVIIMELINTTVEKLVDIVSPQRSERARVIKDISAAAVFLTAISALSIGAILFTPKIIVFFTIFK